jgi:hypothetical protein
MVEATLLFGLTYLGVRRLCDKTPPLNSVTRFAAPIGLSAFVLWGCLLSFRTARLDRDTDDAAARGLAKLEVRH